MLVSANLPNRLSEAAAAVEACLEQSLSTRLLPQEIARPRRLMEAMRYAALGGGKRFRPFLTMETARLFGVDSDSSVRAATAVECIHCYSLAHDDLPAMDDDDLRRGRPTVHRAFDEATSILAGDGLLTYAFDLLADEATSPDPAIRAELVLVLARAVGPGGMVGGQMVDIQSEYRTLTDEQIVKMQAMKTGALIRASVEAGAVLGGADEDARATLARYGNIVGLAFQLADDLLDVEASPEIMGKATGKDGARGKATQVARHGADWARSELTRLVQEADACLADFGDRGAILREAARFVATRKS